MVRRDRLAATVRELPPAAFSIVMATGIVSTALSVVGWTVPSAVLLVLAVAALVLLAVGVGWRVARYPAALLADCRDPAKAFGFLTVVAGINVVGVRLYSELPVLTIILAAVSVPFWVLLSYGVPAALILQQQDQPAAAAVNGSWFLWVVATQSLATTGAVIDAGLDPPARQWIATAAVAMWGIGVVLYLMLATMVTLRLLTTRSEAETLGPASWIYMGATAITVLAGSRILLLPPDLPVMAVTSAVVSGITFVLWAFGVWWIPLLLIFGAWRHLVRRVPLRYELELWSMVFPLGMYSVASMHFGEETGLSGIQALGQVGTWIAGLAWLATAAAMAAHWLRQAKPNLS
ncbi:MAG: tellurite resistance/C4-dicarboxylate transporter family protein [Nakamurella sp.]